MNTVLDCLLKSARAIVFPKRMLQGHREFLITGYSREFLLGIRTWRIAGNFEDFPFYFFVNIFFLSNITFSVNILNSLGDC